MDFNGKNVVVVAGLGGIGYETCKQFMIKNIAYLAVLDIAEKSSAVQALQDLNPKCRVRYLKFDITDKCSIKSTILAIVAETKCIDILVNCAGILLENDVDRTINVNLIGMINTTYEALPYMDKCRNGRGGLVANIASVAGFQPIGPIVAYTASKYGVIGFTRCMADQYYFDLTGIAFTAICPGLTETKLKDNAVDNCSFDYSKTLMQKVTRIKSQTAATCAENFMRIIEICKNGSLWICDLGKLTEVQPEVLWTPPLKS